MITRRRFLGGSAALGAAMLTPASMHNFLSPRPGSTLTTPLLEPRAGETLITILHTNDTHSQIDPFPADDLVTRARRSRPACHVGEASAAGKR